MVKRFKTGIGCDIVEIPGFAGNRRSALEKFRKVFTDKEFEYCFSKSFPSQHLAARFAAKEAVIKGFSALNYQISEYHDIEIRNIRKRPRVFIKNMEKGYDISISLAHCKMYAIAYAHITKW